jgi:hypothetical protein
MFGADTPEFGMLPPLTTEEHAGLVTDLQDNPMATLQNRMISSNDVAGMKARYGDTLDDNQRLMLLKWFDGRLGPDPRPTEHWYVLTPDPRRTTADKPAFVLTPAVERYLRGQAQTVLDYFGITLEKLSALQSLQLPDDSYLRPSLVPYHSGQPGTEGIGHATVGGQDAPDIVVTPAMNGCAFVISGGSDANQPFTATHFQSPKSFQPAMERFIRDNAISDWFGDQEYARQTHSENGRGFDATNFLWRRGPGEPWHIVSQEMSYPADSEEGHVVVERTQTRPVTLAPMTDVQKTGLILSQKAKFEWERTGQREIEDLVGRMPDGNRKEAIQTLSKLVRQSLAADMDDLKGAATQEDLVAAARRIRDRRADNGLIGQFKELLSEVERDSAEEIAKVHKNNMAEARAIMKKQADISKKLASLIDGYQQTPWLDSLPGGQQV